MPTCIALIAQMALGGKAHQFPGYNPAIDNVLRPGRYWIKRLA
jgi:hypothetical protein